MDHHLTKIAKGVIKEFTFDLNSHLNGYRENRISNQGFQKGPAGWLLSRKYDTKMFLPTLIYL